MAFTGLLLLGGLSLGGAEYYTSRPDFCGTCHIMDSYYKSWSKDVHGAKVGARCVDCHYAPGEQHTIHAKFKGLSQLASYFSGRYGAARPRAHVNDNSCLTSGCHGNNEYRKKLITIGQRRMEIRTIADRQVEVERLPTVHYTHEKHLDVEKRAQETAAKLTELKDRLKHQLNLEEFERLEKAVTAVGDFAGREQQLRATLAELKNDAISKDAAEWMHLEHLNIRLQQLSKLNCAACHSYDPTGVHHLAVDRQTCFTCHFTGQAFNKETGECLRCHEPPVRKIAIHGAAASSPTAPAMMDHRDIVERHIDCASCHFDVIQGETRVTARECTHCHDQEKYLKNFATRTTETVQDYHQIHVAQQRARCPDCHRQIQHQLIEPSIVAGSAAPLKPVIDDCQHCHPAHHQEQVDLLMGVGAKGVTEPMPNAMFGSRVNCRACHTQAGSDFKGAALVAATKNSCVSCHGSDYEKLFERWLSEMKNALAEAEKALDRVQKRADELAAAGKPVPEAVRTVLTRSRENIHLVKSGNGVHNKNFAMQLLDMATRDLDDAAMKLSK
ncbi:MAG TPA: NapC/NirT family cytochrome c [Phycisphaerae bacterium]|nr:NapC/NirT family cytochrome c [Phycisphaerae bacterium]